MAHAISLAFSKQIEISNSDITIVVRKGDAKLGTLTLSKGTIDWLPKNQHSGGKGETSLSWTKFAEMMKAAG